MIQFLRTSKDNKITCTLLVRVRGKIWLREPPGNGARKKVLYLARWRQRRKNFPRTLKSEPARRQIGRTPLSIVDNLLALAKY